ncbi:MAG: methionine ABC transporter [Bacteroidetes bacterium]|nr:MAG: methionine ABC transporter [Bacteroidota bacterium]
MTHSKQRKQKRRLVLNFPSETVNEPITCKLIRDYELEINILNADISHGKEGKLLVEMKGSAFNLNEAMVYLESRGVELNPVVKTILFKSQNCVHCGACTSVCFSGALNLGNENRELVFSPEKCVACELCIKACPLQLFETNFSVG